MPAYAPAFSLTTRSDAVLNCSEGSHTHVALRVFEILHSGLLSVRQMLRYHAIVSVMLAEPALGFSRPPAWE